MGEHLRRLLELGIGVVYAGRREFERFVAEQDVSPLLAELLAVLPGTFPSAAEAIAWLDRPAPAFDASPFDLIAHGEASRVLRALLALNTGAAR